MLVFNLTTRAVKLNVVILAVIFKFTSKFSFVIAISSNVLLLADTSLEGVSHFIRAILAF